MNKLKPLDQNTELIRNVKVMFNDITPSYDILNRIISVRRDVAWRRRVVKSILPEVQRVIDIATGTGDLALEMVKKRPKIEVIGVDFVPMMLSRACRKTAKAGFDERVTYAIADAINLPFPDNSFDAATIAFGLRNIPDNLQALREMARVVRPGGKVLVLEMTFPRNLKIRRFFFWYLNRMIPLIGGLISGNFKAYRYLPDTIQNFHHPDKLSELFKRAGMFDVCAYPLTLGIAYLHEGVVK
ncbi:MAG: bifunctional demethylmenaquinone methyltransferase/2-methoxy-6-polyprenyl-1,4-benzoquinol methylase UbiE [Candidatus Hatepunaea meridiana]|nr:bifunctional demethylmenaquinone methyltransferase/2-methoxy-6-polyprenyl-1,4-benzoquinol methylase UbiE [Candidatus Hatepunaea meridiana]